MYKMAHWKAEDNIGADYDKERGLMLERVTAFGIVIFPRFVVFQYSIQFILINRQTC